MRVHVLAIRDDLVSWIKTLPGDGPTPAESTAGTLAGFWSGPGSGSVHCDLCADDTVVYIQDAVTAAQPSSRAAFDYQAVDLWLPADNVLLMKLAAWLNTTGKPIHLELTYTIKFEYAR